MNSPIPSLPLPLWQNESLCETTGMKIWCHLYSHSHENQVIFMIFMTNVLHKHSFCKWKLRRWKSKSAYTLFCFIRMFVFPAQAEYSYFSADFRLKNILVLFLNYSLWHFRFRIYWGINYKCLVFRYVLRYIVHVLHCFFVAVIEV